MLLVLLLTLLSIGSSHPRHNKFCQWTFRQFDSRYEIVKLSNDTTFPLTSNWTKIGRHPHCTDKLEDYSLVRLDDTTAGWNLSDSLALSRSLKRLPCKRQGMPMFKPECFLSSLRNKRVGFLGDSLLVQVYESLLNAVAPYCTNITEVFPQNNPGIHYCSSTNTTLYFVFEQRLELDSASMPANPQTRSRANGTDLFILGTGAWFEPMFYDDVNSVDYNQSLHRSRIWMENNLSKFRDYLCRHHPESPVIWKLISHVGPNNENFKTNRTTNRWFDGAKWSKLSNGLAMWVRPYNDVITAQARLFGDITMDYFSLSTQFLDYFEHIESLHVDHLHYCTTGMPKCSLLLLQDAVQEAMLGGV